MTSPPEDRSPMASAAAWASRIMTISAEMVVPGLLGLWLDRYLGTWFVLALIGFAVGLTVAIMHLVRLGSPNDKREAPDDGPSAENS